MRPFDLYMERQVSDRSDDTRASRAMSREVNDLSRKTSLNPSLNPSSNPSLRDVRTLNMQDKSALTSVGLLVGSSFMLFGLGATFAAVDEMDLRKQLNAENKEQELQDHQDQAAVHADEVDKQNLLHKDALNTIETKLPLAVTIMDLANTNTNLDRLGKKPKTWLSDDKAVSPDIKRSRPFMAPNKNFLEVSKLVKQKEFLLGQIERFNKSNQLNVVAKLHSELELLDKALKRVGC